MKTETLSQRMAARCAADGEFRLAARYWTGGLRFDLGDGTVDLVLADGRVSAGDGTATATGAGYIDIRAPAEVWAKILAPVPPPFFNDILPARGFGLKVDGGGESFWQYYPAVRRAVDLLREERGL